VPSNRDQLQQLIEASGLSARRFARLLAWRDERTIRRWLAGEPMPAVVTERLQALSALEPPAFRALVRLVDR
jgi:hypothetical protein